MFGSLPCWPWHWHFCCGGPCVLGRGGACSGENATQYMHHVQASSAANVTFAIYIVILHLLLNCEPLTACTCTPDAKAARLHLEEAQDAQIGSVATPYLPDCPLQCHAS